MKIPWTHSRASAYMRYNMLRDREKKKVKRQARREFRRWLKQEIEKYETA